MDWLIDITEEFFAEHPGYHAIFMEVQGSMPELDHIKQVTDVQLIQHLSLSLEQRDPELKTADCDAIAFVLVKAIGTLLWLSLSQEPDFRQRLVKETKRLALNYIKSYALVTNGQDRIHRPQQR